MRNVVILLVLTVAVSSQGATTLSAPRIAVVTAKDGRLLEGDLLDESETHITLNISGNRYPIKRSEIDKIEFKLPIAQQYKERRVRLAVDDLNGRHHLAYWLYEQKAYEMAMRELTDLQRHFPEEKRVKSLMKVVECRLKLKQNTTGNAGSKTAADGRKTEPAIEVDRHGLPTGRLDAEQINIIKVYEVDLSGRPAVHVPKETQDMVIEVYGKDDPQLLGDTNRHRFRGAKGHLQLAKMFELATRHPGIRALYRDVSIRRDPPSMLAFRKVHRYYVLNYCGSVGCHGGSEAGSFFLFRQRPTSDETVYTNFYILDTFKSRHKDDMIERGDPPQSLLIQYGLPRSSASNPHPEHHNWRPKLRPRNDDRQRMIVDWIEQLQPQRPYGIKYTAPRIKVEAEEAVPADTKDSTQATKQPDPDPS